MYCRLLFSFSPHKIHLKTKKRRHKPSQTSKNISMSDFNHRLSEKPGGKADLIFNACRVLTCYTRAGKIKSNTASKIFITKNPIKRFYGAGFLGKLRRHKPSMCRIHHTERYSRTSEGFFSALTFSYIFSIFPSSSITNVVRTTPMEVLP